MQKKYLQKFHALSPFQITSLAMVLLALVASIDHLTGNAISISFFYLLPIVLMAWYGSIVAAYLLCFLSALIWGAIDYHSGNGTHYWLVDAWNSGTRLGFFALTTYLLSHLKHLLVRLEALATTDNLTGLLNERAFHESALRLFDLATRHQRPLALGFIDLDNFKLINDQYGHAAGDQALKQIAQTMQTCVRSSDIVARLGGDEFAILLMETTHSNAEAVFIRLYEALRLSCPQYADFLGFSIGVAAFSQAPATVEEALEIADQIMYRVKKTGKNRVLFEMQFIRSVFSRSDPNDTTDAAHS